MILFCGPPSPTLDYLRRVEGGVRAAIEDPIESVDGVDMIVSHGYRHIIKPEVLERVPAVNLHIAFLPWNRGAHPNFWSVYEGTPGGVTVHWMDAGIDTGPIIAQRRVRPEGTFASSHGRLQVEMTDLFKEFWPVIRAGLARSYPQSGQGSYHRVSDLEPVEHLLTRGWDTPVADATRVAA